jgi:hypothetical protein
MRVRTELSRPAVGLLYLVVDGRVMLSEIGGIVQGLGLALAAAAGFSQLFSP